MNLIAVMVMALLAPVALLGAFRAFKLSPTAHNRISAVALLLTAFAFALVSAILVPGARMRDTQAEADRAQVRLDARLAEVRGLSEALGGPQAYIEYLKATKPD
jgi:hypothetical protein